MSTQIAGKSRGRARADVGERGQEKRERVQRALDAVLDAFRTGNVGKIIARTVLRRQAVPCDKWSLSNRILTALAGTDDARGIRQWNTVGRHVRKGSRAFYILAPRTKRIEVADDAGETHDEFRTIGFVGVPVFRFEDTDGAEIDRPNLEPADPPPLADVAERFGCAVSYQGFMGKYLGYYAPGDKRIVLASHDLPVFFHELSHAAHDRVIHRPLSDLSRAKREAVAELSATVLANLYGIDHTGDAYTYIRSYAGKTGPHRLCLSVLADVEKVLAEILGTVEANAEASAAVTESEAA